MANLRAELARLMSIVGGISAEATLRQYFIQALDEFARQEKLSSIDAGPLFRLEEPIIRGRADAKIGGLCFETKLPKPKGKGIDEAKKQVIGYVKEYEDNGIQVRGIAY